jgi:hypothetical protein
MSKGNNNQAINKGNNKGNNQDDNKEKNVMSTSNNQANKGNKDMARMRLANKRTIAASGAHPTIATIASAAIDTWDGKLTINAVFNADEIKLIQAAIDSFLPGEQKKIDPMLFGERPSGIAEDTWKKYVKAYFNDMASGALPIRNGMYYKAIPIRVNQYIWFVKTGDVIRALEYAGCFGTLSSKDADDVHASAAYAMRMSAARMAAPLAMDVYNMAHAAIKAHKAMIKAIDKHAFLVAERSAAIKQSKAHDITDAERSAARDRVTTLDADVSKADGRKLRACEAYVKAERGWVDAWARSQSDSKQASNQASAAIVDMASNQASNQADDNQASADVNQASAAIVA